MSDILSKKLSKKGQEKIEWVASFMPLLNKLKEEFRHTQPFHDYRIAISIHLEAKTAYLAMVLAEGGAKVFVTGSNPLSTQDDVAAALVEYGFEVNAICGANEKQYQTHLIKTLACNPQLILDDGGDFTKLLHNDCSINARELIGGCEETTTGLIRLHAREKKGKLNFPMIAVNDADCKHLFDNRYGTGQSTLTAIMATTNLTISSRTIVVAGYGWCGKGVAMRARGMGARVIVTEIDPIKAIEAVMDGFEVMTMIKAAQEGDIFITVTGCKDVIVLDHLKWMKDGAILCNAGHFDCEINKKDLVHLSKDVNERKPSITGYHLKNGRTLNLLAEGRLVNLAAGMGHPAEIMDMSFAIQAKSLEYLILHKKELEKKLYPVPKEIDLSIAKLKLNTLNINIDHLTPDQELYLNSINE